jgi:hypothetical protein
LKPKDPPDDGRAAHRWLSPRGGRRACEGRTRRRHDDHAVRGPQFEGYYSAPKDAVREEVNAWLRSTRDLDGVIDADEVLRDPAHPSKLLAAFDSGDHLHPNDAGNERLAAATPLDICAGPVVPSK